MQPHRHIGLPNTTGLGAEVGLDTAVGAGGGLEAISAWKGERDIEGFCQPFPRVNHPSATDGTGWGEVRLVWHSWPTPPPERTRNSHTASSAVSQPGVHTPNGYGVSSGAAKE